MMRIKKMTFFELKAREKYCDGLIAKAKKGIDELPEGQLRTVVVSRRKGKTVQYFWRKGKDVNGTYLKAEDRRLIQDLAQKEYYRMALKELENEKRLISRFLKEYNPNALVEIQSRMKPGRGELVIPFEYSDDEYAQRWQEKKFTAKPFGDEDLEIYTKRGERVRSKSEQIIADRLYYSNVPYRFEYPVTLADGTTIHTDFTVLNRKTRVSIRWEHFGMMDDPNYRTTAFWKMAKYAENGYYQGKNIIYTFEDGKNPLDSRYLDRLIKKYFL